MYFKKTLGKSDPPASLLSRIESFAAFMIDALQVASGSPPKDDGASYTTTVEEIERKRVLVTVVCQRVGASWDGQRFGLAISLTYTGEALSPTWAKGSTAMDGQISQVQTKVTT